jgi:hypothetical protein
MVVWALTAGIGIYLLAVGFTAQRARVSLPEPKREDATVPGATVTGAAALAGVLDGQAPGAPPGARRPAAEESALLEFMHPALALLGLTVWIFFMVTGERPFAWIAFGVVVATVAAGLSWEATRRRNARRRERDASRPGTGFPPHLIMLHGLAAACTFALVVIAAVVAGHG